MVALVRPSDLKEWLGVGVQLLATASLKAGPGEGLWVGHDGAQLSQEAVIGATTTVYRNAAIDTLGWVNVRRLENQIEVWCNPLAVTKLAVAGAVEAVSRLRERDATVRIAVHIHDREPRGDIAALDPDAIFECVIRGISKTSQPSHPVSYHRLDPTVLASVKDPALQAAFDLLNRNGSALDRHLIEMIEKGRGTAAVLLLNNHEIQCVCHTRDTPQQWGAETPFSGRFLEDLPIPSAIQHSLRNDSWSAVTHRETVVCALGGVRAVAATTALVPDNYLRITIPLSTAGLSPDGAVLIWACSRPPTCRFLGSD